MKKNGFGFVVLSFLLLGGDQAARGGDGSAGEIIDPAHFKRIEAEGKNFHMGSPRDEEGRDIDEGSENRTLARAGFSRSFAMMITEVTQRQWFDVMGENPSYFRKKKYCTDSHIVERTDRGEVELCPNHPVERVSWRKVQKFIDKLSEKLGLEDCHGSPDDPCGRLRLPTEAEWEFAARGGKNTAWFFGNDSALLNDYGWYGDNSNGQTHPTGPMGFKKANPFGLYDMHGNVGEWVLDKYRNKLPGGIDPFSDFGLYGVFRGGSWKDRPRDLRSARRGRFLPAYRSKKIGFRLVKTL